MGNEPTRERTALERMRAHEEKRATPLVTELWGDLGAPVLVVVFLSLLLAGPWGIEQVAFRGRILDTAGSTLLWLFLAFQLSAVARMFDRRQRSNNLRILEDLRIDEIEDKEP